MGRRFRSEKTTKCDIARQRLAEGKTLQERVEATRATELIERRVNPKADDVRSSCGHSGFKRADCSIAVGELEGLLWAAFGGVEFAKARLQAAL